MSPPAAPAAVAPTLIIQQAKRFLQICGLPSPKGEARTQLDTIYQTAAVWDVSWNGYDLSVEEATGHVISFEDWHRRDERYHNRGRTGERRFGTVEEASAEAWRLARAIGVPDHAYLPLIVEHLDTQIQNHDANPVDVAAGISWSFDGGPNYPLLGVQAGQSSEPGMNFMLDSQDGQVIEFSRNLRGIVEASALRLTDAQAVEIAQEAYRRWASQDHGLALENESLDAPITELGYVTPGGLFDFVHGVKPPLTDPLRWRLAWGVYFGATAIFVDVGNGTVLGGQRVKGRPGSLQAKPKKVGNQGRLETSFMRGLLQNAAEITVYLRTAQPPASRNRLVLSDALHKAMFLSVKQSKDFQSQPPAFTSQVFVVKGKLGRATKLHYDHEAGLLGVGDQWCFVPKRFRSWMQSRVATASMSSAKGAKK